MSATFWIIIAVYIGILAYLGFASWRKTKSAEDYILAGSKIGVFVGMLTFAASLFSTFTIMGMPNYFREHGVGAWIFLAIPDAVMFMLIIGFGLQLRRVAAKHNYQGMAGLLRDLYGSPVAGAVYFAGIFLFLIPYVAIQIQGITTFMDAATGSAIHKYWWSVGIVAIMLGYSEFGGLRAIVHCDVVQGTILLIVLWIIAAGCVASFGGVEAMFDRVREVQPALLSTPGPKGVLDVQYLLGTFFAIILLPITQPHLTTRLVIVKCNRTLGQMAIGLGVFTLAILLPTIAIGLYGAVHYAGVPSGEFIAGVLLKEQTPLVGALVLVGLLAAATSTADSQLFALGAELRSLALLRAASPLVLTRIAVFAFGITTLLFSIYAGANIVPLARTSFQGTSLMAPMILAAVFGKRRPGIELPIATALGLAVFLLSKFGVVPDKVHTINLDLIILPVLAAVAAVSCVARGKGGSGAELKLNQ